MRLLRQKAVRRKMESQACDTCENYTYDDEEQAYFCDKDMDEDDYGRVVAGKYKTCPFYRNGDEYQVVRHQAF